VHVTHTTGQLEFLCIYMGVSSGNTGMWRITLVN